MYNPYKVVVEFEKEVANYAGSKYGVAVDSCSNAIFLCCKYFNVEKVSLPKHTYPSVPCAVINSGGKVSFIEREWADEGFYRLEPYPIYDAAHMFQKGMYKEFPYFLCGGDASLYPHSFMCISFSATKPVNIGKGGMILTDDKESVRWFKQARYCGRHEVPLMEDEFEMLGWNMYMTPDQAARGMLIMNDVDGLKRKPNPEYPDLSQYEIYK